MGTLSEKLKLQLEEEEAAKAASTVTGAAIFTQGASQTISVVEVQEETVVSPLAEVTIEEEEVLLHQEELAATALAPSLENVIVEEAELVEEPEPKLEVEVVTVVESPVVLTTQPTLADTSVFQNLTTTSEATGLDGSDSYAELVESMVSQQCQMSGVKNLDLTTFGLRAQVLNFPNLSVMNYGVHKFLGAPFTQEEENLIIHRLGLYVAQSGKGRIVVRAVQEVKDTRGMSFYSLLFNDKIAQRFANMFNYTVHANVNEADVSKLVLVIQK